MATQPLSLSPLERAQTLTEKVMDAIVQAVMERRIPFGSRLVEAELSRVLNVSRVPVREALRLLESQGVVTNTPYKGMCLMSVDDKKLHEILSVRALLEERAVRLAIGQLKAGDATTDGVRDALKQMRRALEDGSAARMAASDIGFHRALLQITGNETLSAMWEIMARQFQMIVGIAWHSLDTERERNYRDHERLLALIEQHDVDAIAQEIVPHIMEGVSVGLRDLAPPPNVAHLVPRNASE
ncbi:MAG: GntR family transcriptional regulator [Novosphingobium sp.]|uniref:GntR family transcriptional regulator n=1 Tax=Novosphingobium sp. TaxID=1874826 RepID=UPI0022CB2A15|nr:GntR family transcriptional regulator [Novosphingobium sp.]MCZ8036362.1 GntR family transcriptional regulator [Novosphingobium sp.]